MPEPVQIIDSLGGIATRQQLISKGCSGFDLTIAVRKGLIRRVRQARYSTPIASADAIAAARVGGLLAGPSAAKSYGFWSGPDRKLQISIGVNSSRLRTNKAPSLKPLPLTPDRFDREVVLHWLKGGAVPERGPDCWRVDPITCLRQVIAWSDAETAVACLDSALTKLRISSRRLANEFVEPTIREQLILQTLKPGSDSGLESIVRQRLAASGIVVDQQVKFPFGRVDMQIPGTKLIIEVDGESFHGLDQIETDRRRDAELVALGFSVIRLGYTRIMQDWPDCLRVIRSSLTRFHHSGVSVTNVTDVTDETPLVAKRNISPKNS